MDKLFSLSLEGMISEEQFFALQDFQRQVLFGIGTIAFPYFNGQYSDGWGEGFSQRGIETSYGVLYLDFWSDDFYIETEDILSWKMTV